jgi:hypothetical protein
VREPWLWVALVAIAVVFARLFVWCVDADRADVEACKRRGGSIECETTTSYVFPPTGGVIPVMSTRCSCVGVRP